MATDDVIANLVRDLQPVRPLPLPRVRFAQWGLVAVPVMAIVMAAIGPRIDLVAAAATWSFQALDAARSGGGFFGPRGIGAGGAR